MPDPTIEVRPLATVEEFTWLEGLQKRVWGFVDADTVPLHTLVAVAHNGGVVLGGFDREREGPDALVGMTFGFDGSDELGPKHHSHQLGVDPRVRNVGLGARLKWAQRRQALARDRARVTWTFDPLMAPNAWFNLRVLGGVASRYIVDIYGEIRDELNRGLPTDRLIVDWWLDDPTVVARAEGARPAIPDDEDPLPDVLSTEPHADGPHRRPGTLVSPAADRVRLEIPADLLALKRDDPAVSLAWRQSTREAFLTLFERGFVACDVRRVDERRFYVFERRGQDGPPATVPVTPGRDA